jgi:inner membrane protein
MASVISHPAIVLALVGWFRSADFGPRAWLLGALCAVLPDADVIGYWLGIPYGSPLGHRGLTHSLFFAAALAAALTILARPPRRADLFLFLFLCGASHGVFDAMTRGGGGIAFFAPFENGRRSFPWRPLRVSPIGIDGFFGRRGVAILRTEILWIWLPCLAFGTAAWLLRRRGRTVTGAPWK